MSCCSDAKLNKVGVVSQKDIAKDQGKPISKYERNMLIFDWLHTLGKNLTLRIETLFLTDLLNKLFIFSSDESATANTSHELQFQAETGPDLTQT